MGGFNPAWFIAVAIGILLVAADFMIPEARRRTIGRFCLAAGVIALVVGIAGLFWSGHDRTAGRSSNPPVRQGTPPLDQPVKPEVAPTPNPSGASSRNKSNSAKPAATQNAPNGTAVGTVTVQPGSVASFGQRGGQTAGTIINNPSARPELLKVSFSNSQLFSDDIQERIREDLTAFRAYLVRLRLDLSTAVPPISIGSPHQFTKPLELTGPAGAEDLALMLPSGGRYEARIYPGQKPSTDFNQNLVLMPSEIPDRKPIMAAYGMYAIGQVIDRIEPDPDDFYSQMRSEAMTIGSLYFTSSFLGEEYLWYEPSTALWEIREKLGKNQADQLIAYTVRAFSESIYRKRQSAPLLYFYNRIKDAAELMDDVGAMKDVTAIWKKHGLPVQ